MIKIRDKQGLQDYINNLLSRQEADDLEYKSAAGGFPGSFWETYSSFANTNGGTIILGIAEKKEELYLDDLTDEQIDQYQKIFWSTVNNKAKVNRNLMANDNVELTEYNGHKMLLFYVPRA